MRLKDKVTVVTGGTAGLGAAMVRRFAAEGALLIVGGRDKAKGEGVIKEVRDAGGTADLVIGDVKEESTSDAIVALAREKYGRIDVLALNAGVFGGFGRFWDVSSEEYDRLMDTNVKGMWLQAKAAYPLLKEGSNIVITSAASAHIIYPDESLYSMSKGALTLLTMGMANDLGERGIRVNAVCPGPTTSGMARWFYDQYKDPKLQEKRFADAMALGRLGTEDEIAAVALFLASDEASFVTGVSLLADGGTVTRSTDWSLAAPQDNAGAEAATI
jgi:NAD(P)-dependent dehydrogenase (short-subunit alcohol dehydrogenase family)